MRRIWTEVKKVKELVDTISVVHRRAQMFEGSAGR